ncbi:hypothetical protein EDB81DRAFT_814241 [Dactylonectria macrodidyma]|uniref:Uncharacterized protein n=1 Tax=Dactylonectria macrodidyma TaxID=307937 RepID=A0A9P9DLY8_9HYPO|nr:hypothetical protein EDB81DRAFT_814241 [Dactylonectria macrodidyma]
MAYGLYVNIVVGDYLRTLLNLNRNPVQSDWEIGHERISIISLTLREPPGELGTKKASHSTYLSMAQCCN